MVQQRPYALVFDLVANHAKLDKAFAYSYSKDVCVAELIEAALSTMANVRSVSPYTRETTVFNLSVNALISAGFPATKKAVRAALDNCKTRRWSVIERKKDIYKLTLGRNQTSGRNAIEIMYTNNSKNPVASDSNYAEGINMHPNVVADIFSMWFLGLWASGIENPDGSILTVNSSKSINELRALIPQLPFFNVDVRTEYINFMRGNKVFSNAKNYMTLSTDYWIFDYFNTDRKGKGETTKEAETRKADIEAFITCFENWLLNMESRFNNASCAYTRILKNVKQGEGLTKRGSRDAENDNESTVALAYGTY